MITRKLFIVIALLACAHLLVAQPAQKLITVVVEPNRADWTYKVGEEAKFNVYVIKNKVPLNNIAVSYNYGPEMMPPVKKGTIQIKDSKASIKVPGMKTPGFQTVRASVEIDGVTYSSYTNIGYEPEKIEPTTTLPKDFTEFWEKNKKDVAQIPLNPLMTLMPELCTTDLDVYHVRFLNDAFGSYIYGMLCVPKKPGTYPAVLQVPGAGLHSFTGYKSLASKGVITLEIGIHGIPVNLPQEVYHNLASGALRDYSLMNLDNKNKYYFKRVFMGCVRAIDFIFTLDAFDKENIAVMGGSQGGALSIITASLDPRITCFTARHPGMCDMAGDKIETLRYYDAVNFARFIKVPGCFTWGYNDQACPPTTMYAAYNVIAAEKELKLYTETAHWHFNEQMNEVENWVLQKLKVF